MPHSSLPKIPFTRAAYEKMQADFDRLTQERVAVMERLKVAREMGDLSENGAYRYAKFELGSIGRQLRQLQHLLENGEIIENTQSDRVGFGSSVTVNYGTKSATYIMVSKHESDPQKGKLSLESPIGRALMGRALGDEVRVDVPAGVVTYRITKIA